MRTKGFFRGALLAAAVTLALLTGIIRIFACSADVYEREMTRFAPPEATGLPAAEYPGMAAHIADYLAGRKESFQYVFTTPAGESYVCFHENELIHMADCRALIRLDGTVCLISLAIAAGCGLGILRGDRDVRRGAQRGARSCLWALSVIAAGLVLWAVIDFDSLFLTFHRAAFRNDLWLMSSRTDLLIRLMPEAMFVDLGLKGFAAFAAGMTLTALGTVWWKRRVQ